MIASDNYNYFARALNLDQLKLTTSRQRLEQGLLEIQKYLRPFALKSNTLEQSSLFIKPLVQKQNLGTQQSLTDIQLFESLEYMAPVEQPQVPDQQHNTGLSQGEALYRSSFLRKMLKQQQTLLDQQPSANRPMFMDERGRDWAVHWAVLIQTKFDFEAETLHAGVANFNRYLAKKPYVSPAQYERIMLTCFWMSAKMEQRRVKTLSAWLVFGRGYTCDQLIETQEDILEALEFKMIVPNSFLFFQAVAAFHKLSDRTVNLCKYLVDLTVVDSRYFNFQSHLIGAASVYLALKVLGGRFNQTVLDLLNLDFLELRRCAEQLSRTLQDAHCSPMTGVYRKYCSRKYQSIARIKLGRKSVAKSVRIVV